jgi:GAF domain-containing protein/CheY-like chemotaxis protein
VSDASLLAVLGAMARAIAGATSAAGVAGAVAEAAMSAVRPRSAMVWLATAAGGGIGIAARAGAGPSPSEAGLARVAAAVLEKGEAIRRTHAGATLLGAPIAVNGRVFGALTADTTPPVEAGARILATVAEHAAAPLDAARLLDEVRAHEAHLGRLLTINTRISALASSEALLTTVAEEAMRLLGIDNAGFRLVDGDELVMVGPAGTARDVMLRPSLKIGESLSGRVVAEGATREYTIEAMSDVIVPDHLEADRRLGYTTFLGVPLHVAGRTIGVLTLRARRPFEARERQIAEAFAAQAAIVLESARLHEETERQRRHAETRATRMRALARVNQLVSSSLDAERVLATIVTTAADLVRAPFVDVFVLDEARGVLALGAASPGRAADDLGRPTFRPDEGIVGWVARHRRPLEVPDIFADPRFVGSDWARRHGFRSYYGLPILLEERLLGVLAVLGQEGFRLTDDDHELLDVFAGQAAIALGNARLYREARDAGERLRALEEVNRLISSSLEMAEVIGTVARAVARFLDAPFVSVWSYDPATRRLRRALVQGEVSPGDLHQELEPGQGVVGWVVEQRQPILWTDVAVDTRVVDAPALLARGLRYLTAYPIAIGDRVLGAFAVSRDAPSPMPPGTVTLLASLAAQAAVALDHARLYAETTQQLDQTAALLEVTEILGSTLDTRQLLTRVTMKIAQVARVDRCSLELWNGDTVVPLMSQFADGRRVRELWDAFRLTPPYAPRDVPAHAKAIETRRPVVIDDTSGTDQIPRDLVERFGLKSYLVVPLVRQDEVIGVMHLDYCEAPRAFEPWQIDLAMAIAGHLALSLENARLYDEVRERLREATTLLTVGQLLSGSAPESETMRRVAREVGRALDADMVGAYFFDERRTRLVPLAGYHVPEELREQFIGRPMVVERFPLLRETWRDGRAAWSGDPLADPRFDPEWLRGLPPHSVMFAPAIARGEPMGALFLVWWRPGRTFTAAESRLVEAVARQVGLALENAGLFAENRRQVEELSVLHELSRAVTGQLDRAAVLDALHRQIARVLDVRHMAVLVRDDRADALEAVLEIRDGARLHGEPRRFGMGAGLAGVVVRTGQPIRTEDYATECARRGVAPQVDGTAYPRWLGAPMRVGGEVLGVVALRGMDRAFSAADERLLVNIADLAALALRSAHLFQERTRAYRELAAAQDQLVRTEKLRALGEMASGVAHDFNNLLAAILGRAQLVLGRLEDPKLRQWVETIERAALDGAQTVRRLQEFTRTRRDEPLVGVDLNEIARDALDITQSRWREEASSRGVRIDVRTAFAHVPAVAGDAVELREALTNLILNSVDAMPEGGTLSLRTSRTANGVELIVSDSGIGMPESVRSRIFDPFFTTKGPRGTGLGLSMTYGILSRHGATVEVDTAEGRGTTFRLTFPPSERVLKAPARAPVAAPAPVAPLACLVVDDDPSVGSVVGDIIRTRGHHVVVMNDPAAAVRRIQRERFDVVFTDLAMPGMSGWDVTSAVKTAAPEVPVFMMTGFGVELPDDERERHGLEAVLAKPLQIEHIAAALARAAERRAGRSS